MLNFKKTILFLSFFSLSEVYANDDYDITSEPWYNSTEIQLLLTQAQSYDRECQRSNDKCEEYETDIKNLFKNDKLNLAAINYTHEILYPYSNETTNMEIFQSEGFQTQLLNLAIKGKEYHLESIFNSIKYTKLIEENEYYDDFKNQYYLSKSVRNSYLEGLCSLSNSEMLEGSGYPSYYLSCLNTKNSSYFSAIYTTSQAINSRINQSDN